MKPCECPAYKFPHKPGRKCRELEAEARDELDGKRQRTQQEIYAEMNYLMDRDSAIAINSGVM